MASPPALADILARLKERPGVASVVLATKAGAVVDSTGVDAEEAKLQALHFSKVLAATNAAYVAQGIEGPEVISFISTRREFVLSGVGSGPDCFFITAKDNNAASASAQ
jgi:hypothetical protein